MAIKTNLPSVTKRLLIEAFSGFAVTAALFANTADAQNSSPKEAQSTKFYRSQALINIASHRDQEALESYKAAIKSARVEYGPDSTYLNELYFEMGNLARSNHQSELAASCYRNAVRFRPNDIPTRLELASLERNTKNIQDSFKDAKEAFALDPTRTTSRRELMLCMQQCGRPAEAAQIAITLRRLDKNNTSALNKIMSKNLSAMSQLSISGQERSANQSISVSSNSALHWSGLSRSKRSDETASQSSNKVADPKMQSKETNASEQEMRKEKQTEKQSSEFKQKQAAGQKSKQKTRSFEKTRFEKTRKDGKVSNSRSRKIELISTPSEASLRTTATTISGENIARRNRQSNSETTDKSEKPSEEKQESSITENETATRKSSTQPENLPLPHVSASPSLPPVATRSSKKPHLGRGGLVPPPPATPFIIPSFQMPPPAVVAPQPIVKQKSKNKPKQSAATIEESSAKSADDQAGGDPNFLIEWGDVGKRKKGK